jgi:hypothetical protein
MCYAFASLVGSPFFFIFCTAKRANKFNVYFINTTSIYINIIIPKKYDTNSIIFLRVRKKPNIIWFFVSTIRNIGHQLI